MFFKRNPYDKYNPKITRSKYHSISEVLGLERSSIENTYKPPLFIVVSVELGNTTTKCIVTATDLKTGRTYLVRKTVKLTKEARNPKAGEDVFSRTLWGKPLSEESIAEFIADIITETVVSSGLSIDDIHFVVRSTGVTSSFNTPEEVGRMIKALAKGCLKAKIHPSRMIAPLTKEYIPLNIREYSKLNLSQFTGAIAGSLPPKSYSEIMANEMEAELSTAGIKIGAKLINVDFRNPVITMDFGTTLKGRVINDCLPYGETIGSITGLGGAISDSIIQGAGYDSVIEFPHHNAKSIEEFEVAEQLANEVHKYVRIEKIPPGVFKYGMIPINSTAAFKANILLIGCDIGYNGDQIPKLRDLGRQFIEDYGSNNMPLILDFVQSIAVKRIIEILISSGIISEKYSIGITGRAGITGFKPKIILKYIDDLNLYKSLKVEDMVVFVEDGLALGAAVMAKCMHAFGNPQNPLGGNKGMGCILPYKGKLNPNTKQIS
ncbi:MAG: methanogenesis marker 14 protein [Candidatus Methanomethylicia archaeon]